VAAALEPESLPVPAAAGALERRCTGPGPGDLGSGSIAFSSNVQRRNRDNSRQTPANTSHRGVQHCAKTFDLITTVLALQTPLAEVLTVVA
jgi:hypothetical protein